MPAAVNSELELVHKLVPPQVQFINLYGEDATQAHSMLCDATLGCTSLVMASRTASEQPYNPCFAMMDKPFTLLDIMENDAPQAEFTSCRYAILLPVMRKHLTKSFTSLLVCVQECHWHSVGSR